MTDKVFGANLVREPERIQMPTNQIGMGLPTPMETLLDYHAVAALLSVSTRTIQRYVKLGWLKPIYISRRVVRFRQVEVERFLSRAAGGRDSNKTVKPQAGVQLRLKVD